MDGTRGIPAANENEDANEKIKQADHPLVVFDRRGFLGGRSDQGSLKLLAIADQFVADFGPQSRTPQTLGYLDLGGDRNIIDGDQDVPGPDAYFGSWGVGCEFPGLDTAGGIEPGNAIVGNVEFRALNEIQPGKNKGRKRGESQDYGTEADFEVLLHQATRRKRTNAAKSGAVRFPFYCSDPA
jgi:hypothetical protein